MTFHYIEVETYCHATEDPGRVKEALKTLLGEEIETEEEMTRGHYGNTITIMRCKVSRNRDIKKLFMRLPEEIRDSLFKTLERRTDEDCNFFFRLDRGSVYLKKPALSDGGYVIKFRGKVEAYPAKREKALRALHELFSAVDD